MKRSERSGKQEAAHVLLPACRLAFLLVRLVRGGVSEFDLWPWRISWDDVQLKVLALEKKDTQRSVGVLRHHGSELGSNWGWVIRVNNKSDFFSCQIRFFSCFIFWINIYKLQKIILKRGFYSLLWVYKKNIRTRQWEFSLIMRI